MSEPFAISDHLGMYEQYTQRLEHIIWKLVTGTDAVLNDGGYLVVSNTYPAYDESGDRFVELTPEEFDTVKRILK